MIGSVGIVRAVCEPDQRGAGAGLADGGGFGSAGLRHRGVSLLQLVGLAEAWAAALREAFPGAERLALSPLMVVIEAVSHLARLLSLTVRLWVNMMVSEMLYVIFLGLTVGLFVFVGRCSTLLGYVLAPVPILAPVIFIILHIFVAFVQAFVFTILPVIYLSGAVAEGH